MRERVLLFCPLGLVLTATIILVIAPGAVTWALALSNDVMPCRKFVSGTLSAFVQRKLARLPIR
jgi:hypothetical protein